MRGRDNEDGIRIVKHPEGLFTQIPLPVAFNSVQFSGSVKSDCLRPHGLQHTRLPCPLPTPGACSNSCLSSQWCHPIISSSVVPFSSCFQSFPASGSFPMSQIFTSDGQSIGVSASASVLLVNIQDWFRYMHNRQLNCQENSCPCIFHMFSFSWLFTPERNCRS